MACLLACGCGGADPDASDRGDSFAQAAEEYYRRGCLMGAQDALSGLEGSYTRHADIFDSTFTAQFESGYRKAYNDYSPR